MAVLLLELAYALLLWRQRFANAWLPDLLGFELGYLAPDRWVPDVYALADMRDAQALFFDHSDNFHFATGIEIWALPRHVKKAPRTLLPQGPFVPTQSQLRPAKLRWEIAIRRVTHHVQQ